MILNHMRIILMHRPLILLATALVAVGLSGCSPAHRDAGGGVTIAASFYPLAWVSEQIAPAADVTDLTRPGMEPHDIELTFAQTVDLAQADLVVYERGFQPAVDQGVDNDAEGTTLDVGPVAALKDFTTDPGQVDPHFWQDPLKLSAVAGRIAHALDRIDPTHATSYDARATALQRSLATLDRDYRTGLTRCDRHTVVTSHDAFGYLSRYGIRVAAITGLAPGAEPTPADLAHLQQLIRADGITTVFSETLASPAAADALAHDMGVRSAVLDPIEGLSDATAGQTYLTLMRRNLAALEEANGCTTASRSS
jgi:zinc transport system substrate-binding protein